MSWDFQGQGEGTTSWCVRRQSREPAGTRTKPGDEQEGEAGLIFVGKEQAGGGWEPERTWLTG